MLNRVRDIVRFYLPFGDDDDLGVMEQRTRLQDAATAAIIKVNDLELLEYLEEGSESRVEAEAEREAFIAKALRRYNIDIYKEAQDYESVKKYLDFYGNPRGMSRRKK